MYKELDFPDNKLLQAGLKVSRSAYHPEEIPGIKYQELEELGFNSASDLVEAAIREYLTGPKPHLGQEVEILRLNADIAYPICCEQVLKEFAEKNLGTAHSNIYTLPSYVRNDYVMGYAAYAEEFEKLVEIISLEKPVVQTDEDKLDGVVNAAKLFKKYKIANLTDELYEELILAAHKSGEFVCEFLTHHHDKVTPKQVEDMYIFQVLWAFQVDEQTNDRNKQLATIRGMLTDLHLK